MVPVDSHKLFVKIFRVDLDDIFFLLCLDGGTTVVDYQQPKGNMDQSVDLLNWVPTQQKASSIGYPPSKKTARNDMISLETDFGGP